MRVTAKVVFIWSFITFESPGHATRPTCEQFTALVRRCDEEALDAQPAKRDVPLIILLPSGIDQTISRMSHAQVGQ